MLQDPIDQSLPTGILTESASTGNSSYGVISSPISSDKLKHESSKHSKKSPPPVNKEFSAEDAKFDHEMHENPMTKSGITFLNGKKVIIANPLMEEL